MKFKGGLIFQNNMEHIKYLIIIVHYIMNYNQCITLCYLTNNHDNNNIFNE
jgi:hypothetical protein